MSTYFNRAASLQTGLGKHEPLKSVRDCPVVAKQAAEYWRENVTDYDSCLTYYQKFHPEYPDCLQQASAMYMTKIATQPKVDLQQETWDFLKEIKEIKQQVLKERQEQAQK